MFSYNRIDILLQLIIALLLIKVDSSTRGAIELALIDVVAKINANA
jgi:hypothetical protein